MARSSALGSLIDETAWLDTHEHLLEEQTRIASEPFADIHGDIVDIPQGFMALLVH